jgi:hypothetical protein
LAWGAKNWPSVTVTTTTAETRRAERYPCTRRHETTPKTQPHTTSCFSQYYAKVRTLPALRRGHHVSYLQGTICPCPASVPGRHLTSTAHSPSTHLFTHVLQMAVVLISCDAYSPVYLLCQLSIPSFLLLLLLLSSFSSPTHISKAAIQHHNITSSEHNPGSQTALPLRDHQNQTVNFESDSKQPSGTTVRGDGRQAATVPRCLATAPLSLRPNSILDRCYDRSRLQHPHEFPGGSDTFYDQQTETSTTWPLRPPTRPKRTPQILGQGTHHSPHQSHSTPLRRIQNVHGKKATMTVLRTRALAPWVPTSGRVC